MIHLCDLDNERLIWLWNGPSCPIFPSGLVCWKPAQRLGSKYMRILGHIADNLLEIYKKVYENHIFFNENPALQGITNIG